MSTYKGRALISVFDKEGLLEIAGCFKRHGIEIISSGGTHATLVNAGFESQQVSQFTGFPEIFEGRLKTIHPKVEGGMLYKRGDPTHEIEAEENDIVPIDYVVANLYPFEKVILKEGVTLAEAIENIDIGGPTMIRAAAKNYQDVTVLCDPVYYPHFIQEMGENGGKTTLEFRQRCTSRVFELMSRYETTIAKYLSAQEGFQPHFA